MASVVETWFMRAAADVLRGRRSEAETSRDSNTVSCGEWMSVCST